MSTVHTTTVPCMDVERPGASPGAVDPHVRIISADSGRTSGSLRELWHYRELMYFLIWRDLKARYKQTVMGATWAIIRPVMSMIVFTLVFGKLAGISSGDLPYAIFVFAGLLPWALFSGAVSAAGVSLVTQANLFTKVYFPRIYIPTSCIGVVLVDFLLGLLVYVALMVWYAHLPGISLLLLPVLLAILLVLAVGLGLFLAAVTVTYRDFRSIIPFMMQMWMYLSPVVYPSTIIPLRYRWMLMFNPMTGVIDGFRSCLLNQPMNWTSLAIAACSAVIVFAFGLSYFSRAERRFADIA